MLSDRGGASGRGLRIAIIGAGPGGLCISDYYRAPSGRIVTQWPRSMPALEEALSGLDEDAYEVASRSAGWRVRG